MCVVRLDLVFEREMEVSGFCVSEGYGRFYEVVGYFFAG